MATGNSDGQQERILRHWGRPIVFTVRLHVIQRTVLLSQFCLSVRLSARPSDACIVTKLNNALRIFWYHTNGQSLCYSGTKSGWWAMPSSLWNLRSKWPTPVEKRQLRPISAHNVSTVEDSEKKFNYNEYKVDHGLSNDSTSHTWSAYVTPKCPKGWLKERVFRFYRATACNATHGIAVAILSVCLSARPSDACIVRKLNNALRIFWYHTKRQSL